MHSFDFYSPTKVVFGKDTELRTGSEIKSFGGSRVFCIYGGSSKKSGLLDRVVKTMDEQGLTYELCTGVVPNPLLSFARDAVKKAIAFGADFVLAVGGGSVIDTAKAVADGAANPDTDIWDFWSGKEKVTKALPVGVVLTISAAGSETSSSSVLTNEEIGSKRGLGSDFHRPRFAILNPELTYTLPLYQISCGIVDILMHTLDRYLAPTKGNEVTDEIAEGVLRTAFKYGKIAMQNPADYAAASELMWAGSLSHNGITGLGMATDFAPHQLGHELSAKYGVAHGASLSAVWGAWASYACNSDAAIERFAQYGRKVWGITAGADNEAAKAAIEATVRYFRDINMPTCFGEVKEMGVISDKELNEMADSCTYQGARKTIGSLRVLDRSGIYEVYKLANN
ncbi:MAG: iron-containing alcohol dehydrogenase [Oscillospiraceae bacterium]|nr:iron-containing alcohol dehydrogenase [Oscillospiraceae bacterium]